jgi:hypothetical protein
LQALSWKNQTHKKRAGTVTQGEGPEFKPWYGKKKKKKEIFKIMKSKLYSNKN